TKGLCPFHKEKSPSFVVSQNRQNYHCFGCGESGDVISFVQKYYNLDFKSSVEKLANEYGIECNWDSSGRPQREDLFEINREAAKYYYSLFKTENNIARRYMHNRGITDETLKLFAVGYAGDSWTGLYDYLKSQRFTEKQMLELGLISENKGNYYDKYRNRVMFPIINSSKKVIGFGGRIFGEGNPKYLNSSESPVFYKKNNLYGINITREYIAKEGYVVLVEGYMDVISLFHQGVMNVTASLGTALTENQARMLKRYANKVIISYDGDAAGIKAADRALDELKKVGCDVRVCTIPESMDPDDYIRKEGKKEYKKLLKEALEYLDYKIYINMKNQDMNSDSGKINFIRSMSDSFTNLTPVEADIAYKKLSKLSGISLGAVERELSSGKGNSLKSTEQLHSQGVKKEATSYSIPITNLDKILLKIVITDPSYYLRVSELGEVYESEMAGKIFSLIGENITDKNTVDIKKMLDNMEFSYQNEIIDIQNNVKLGDKEEEIFQQCKDKVVKKRLIRRREQLQLALAMENELDECDSNREKTKSYLEELIEIQERLKGK
ncbi:MAG: DNA primase, partial [Anaerovoracaceae bacterium]